MDNWFPLFFILISLAVILIMSITYLLSMFSRHKNELQRDKKICRVDNDYLNACFERMIVRRYMYFKNYMIFQVINKVSGFTSVYYSAISLAFSIYEAPKYCAFLSSLFSIVFVIIALYLSPNKRVSEYIIAWRDYDTEVAKTISQIGNYKRKNCPADKLEAIEKNIIEFMGNTEMKLTSDAE